MAKQDPRSHRIVITGATDGIGLLLARSYAARGHRIMATGRRPEVDRTELYGKLPIYYICADQSDPARTARSLSEATDRFGWQKIDLAILNAGVGWKGAAEDENFASIDHQIDVNLAGTIAATHALAPALLAGKGRLALIGSSLAEGGVDFATYAATKGALSGLAKSLQEEWHDRAGVTMIHPGPTQTDMHAKAGMQLGAVRKFFMRADRAAAAIERAVRRGEDEREIGRFYAMRAKWQKPGEGQL
jgi:NAD(P)-dependent dehydrogenase (short-subunit alcohol dehydrogenase family)